MREFFRPLLNALSNVGIAFNRAKYYLKRSLGLLRPPKILPYIGFGNHHTLQIRGRVLEEYALAQPEDRANIWSNARAMARRYLSEDIPNARLVARFQGEEKHLSTDDEGYFSIEFNSSVMHVEEGDWYEMEFELLDEVVNGQPEIKATGKVMTSEDHSEFGVISDVDDTILVSRATSTYKKLRLMLFKNAKTRLPFAGVAAFYQALQGGSTGELYNPFFYVSSSSWKLYDLLTDFARMRGIPEGPFLLRNSRLDQYKFISSIHHGHKMRQIELVLATYARIPFIMVGDSGQKDPEIYMEVVKLHPNRIIMIYIRHVSTDDRKREVMEIAKKLHEMGVELLLVKDSEEAAIHAASKGYLHERWLNDIHAEMDADLHAPDSILDTLSAE